MAAAGFRTRRVKVEGVSIGDRLKRSRTRKKLSIGDVEEATRIRAKFLLALESDSWEQIPSEVYGRGYLETYATFLKLNIEEVMRDYDKMRSVYARHCQEGRIELTPKNTAFIPRFMVTPKILMLVALSIGMLGFASIIGYQLRRYAAAPYLELISPAEAKGEAGPGLVVNTESLTVTGRTVAGAVVRVNGQVAVVGEDGGWSYQLSVTEGVNPIVVEATGPSGKTTKEVTSVIVK
ncbi:MAG TPA: helix-turn-helix domain-containing protein [Verrucomicrobiae bacterium]|nr:helix-turn-helix domain-containing protein [Verrucomicrobiae bacterium]